MPLVHRFSGIGFRSDGGQEATAAEASGAHPFFRSPADLQQAAPWARFFANCAPRGPGRLRSVRCECVPGPVRVDVSDRGSNIGPVRLRKKTAKGVARLDGDFMPGPQAGRVPTAPVFRPNGGVTQAQSYWKSDPPMRSCVRNGHAASDGQRRPRARAPWRSRQLIPARRRPSSRLGGRPDPPLTGGRSPFSAGTHPMCSSHVPVKGLHARRNA